MKLTQELRKEFLNSLTLEQWGQLLTDLTLMVAHNGCAVRFDVDEATAQNFLSEQGSATRLAAAGAIRINAITAEEIAVRLLRERKANE